MPGTLGAVGYRVELRGQRSRLVRLGVASMLGGVAGALLLLQLPAAAFDAVVPVLIGLGCVLVLVQPWISRRVRPRVHAPAHGSALVWVLVFLAGVYGGYFGAAQGVLLIAILGLGLAESLQRVNAAKNVLALVVNTVAAVSFIVLSEVAWAAAGLIAAGAVIGGQLGARIGRRLPASVFRGVVVAVGAVAIGKLAFFASRPPIAGTLRSTLAVVMVPPIAGTCMRSSACRWRTACPVFRRSVAVQGRRTGGCARPTARRPSRTHLKQPPIDVERRGRSTRSWGPGPW